MTHVAGRSTRGVVCLILAAIVLAVFWPSLGYDFVDYDDEKYVTANRYVQMGLTAESLSWAWTTFHAANWHPLTWWSHMLDQALFGDEPAGHHLTNVLLHVANTLLLFLVLTHMTSSLLRSAIVAGLFAIHPLHVESVAWIAERKDLLSALFFFLTIAAYVRYVRRPGLGRYLVVALGLALGLLAKPMLVTTPFVLLLLDRWPLRRLDATGHGSVSGLPRLVLEKVPLFVLAAASGVITIAAQSSGRAVASLEVFPLAVRITNAVTAYAVYLWKTIWPAGLAVHYPHARGDLPLWLPLAALVVLIGLTILVVAARRTRPYLLVGWLWYLGMLVPVIGLIQVGSQAMADRYTYLPLIGIFIAVVWAVPATAGPLSSSSGTAKVRRETALLALVFILGPILTVLSWMQLGHWQDARTLFSRALSVTSNNAVAHNGLGLVQFRSGHLEDAITNLRKAVRINPRLAEAHNNLGGALAEHGQTAEAIEYYLLAIEINAAYAEAWNNLGVALAGQDRVQEAIASFNAAVRARPGYGKAHTNLATAYFSVGEYSRARQEIELAREHGHEPPAGLVDRLTAISAD